MKRSVAFFVATVLVSMPITKAYAYWNDKLNVDLTTMFVYPTQILVEEDEQLKNLNPILPLEGSGEAVGGGSSEQNQSNEQAPVVEGNDLLKPNQDTVQNLHPEPVVEEQVEAEQEEINHDTVSEVAGP